MGLRAQTTSTMPFITTCIAIMLVMTGPVTSSILNWRQEGSRYELERYRTNVLIQYD